MNNTSNSLVSGIDPASFSAVTGPSQDLFRFVNGPWVDMYRLPDDRSRYGSFDKLAEDAENQIRDILEEDDCPAVKSRALYHSFLDVDAIDAAGLAAIEDQLASIDEAEDKAALTRALGTMNPTGIAVYGDPGAPETNVVHIEQDGLDLPDEAYYREDHYAPIREAYVEMVAKQLKNAHLAADDEDAHAQAKRFLDVETRIAANHWDNVSTRDSVKTYNPTDYADLCAMLSKMGAVIDGAGSPTLTITGVPRLGGATHSVMPDRIEAGTWIAAALASRGKVLVRDAHKKHLGSFLDALERAECPVQIKSPSSIYVDAADFKLRPIEAITLPYPGLPTDLQAQLCALMTQADGISIITERIYPERFMHVPELARMGANIAREGPSAIISGGGKLSGAYASTTAICVGIAA